MIIIEKGKHLVKETKVNIMLHPVRMRIIQTLIGDRKLTVQQISELLPEVPQATMYRHLNKLLEGEILKIVGENQIRGTLEKVYSLTDNASLMTKEDIDNASKEDHFKFFFIEVNACLSEAYSILYHINFLLVEIVFILPKKM